MSAEMPHAAALLVLTELQHCCYGATTGIDRCTCWEPVFDNDAAAATQQTLCTEAAIIERPDGPCGDCAYRPDSPERAEEPGYAGDPELLERIVVTGKRFFCHDGMRAPVGWLHPAGIFIRVPPAGYMPPMVAVDGQMVPFRLNGLPALVCAGWAARRRSFIERVDSVVQEAS